MPQLAREGGGGLFPGSITQRRLRIFKETQFHLQLTLPSTPDPLRRGASCSGNVTLQTNAISRITGAEPRCSQPNPHNPESLKIPCLFHSPGVLASHLGRAAIAIDNYACAPGQLLKPPHTAQCQGGGGVGHTRDGPWVSAASRAA